MNDSKLLHIISELEHELKYGKDAIVIGDFVITKYK